MENWLSTTQIVDILGICRQAVHKRARRDKWESKKLKNARGGWVRMYLVPELASMLPVTLAEEVAKEDAALLVNPSTEPHKALQTVLDVPKARAVLRTGN